MRKYTTISFIVIAIIGLFTYINTNATTTFSLFGVNVTLFNAIWTMLFLTIFYLVSIIYFGIEKIRTFIFEKNIKKDKENIIKNIEANILYKNQKFPIKELKDIQSFINMVQGLKINPQENEKFPFLEDIIKLQNGEIVDLKKYKLSNDNPWVLKNLENKIAKGDINSAKEALNTPLKDKAINLLSQKADAKEILDNDYPITKETILNNIKSDKLKELIDKSNLSNMEYIQIAQKLYKTNENPEFVMELFKEKIVAYIYLLIEYEMIDEAYEEAKEKEIKLFEYYLLLRQNGIKIDIKEFIDAKL